ncbi:MAG: hypothetical protein HQ559_18190 [Lentisphaerae bacterium]|nr:hypothetical protein [Lentisphaerota bacterium]
MGPLFQRRLRARATFEQVIGVVEALKGEGREAFFEQTWRLGPAAGPEAGAVTLWDEIVRELGEQIGGMDYAAVSVMLKRLELRLQEDRKLRRLTDRAARMLNVEIRHQ